MKTLLDTGEGGRIVSIDLKEVLSRVFVYAILGWVIFIFPFQQKESLKREELYDQQQEQNSAVLHYFMPNAPYEVQDNTPEDDFRDDP
jgi:hypothetical protein